MTPSQKANRYGVTISDIVRHTKKPRRTIERWSVKFPALFEVVCKGVKRKMEEQQ